MAFVLSLAVCLLLALAARQQVLVARLSSRLGRSIGLLCAGWAAALLSGLVAGWFGAALASVLGESAAGIVAAAGLVLGAVALCFPGYRRLPDEPTRSFGAIFFVLLAGKLFDPVRLFIAAFAILTGSVFAVGIGGAIGDGLALTYAWALRPRREGRGPARGIRSVAVLVMIAAAAAAGLVAAGVV